MKHNMHQYNDRIKRFLEANAPMKLMVYELNVPPQAIKDHIEYWFDIKRVVTFREKPPHKNQMLINNEFEIIRLHNQGYKNNYIATKFNCSVQQVYQFIRRRKGK